MIQDTGTCIVIIVDKVGRYAKSRILRSAGYQVVESETGADALRLTRELLPTWCYSTSNCLT